jgi:hypothetical protein
MKEMSLKDFKKQATKLYGEDSNNWKYKCPRCETIQEYKDFINAGVKPEDIDKYIGFSCIGRWDKNKGCDWTLGGLFQIHKLEIIDNKGNHHPHFEFAD